MALWETLPDTSKSIKGDEIVDGKRTFLGLLVAPSSCRGPREPKAGLAGGRCFPMRGFDGCGISVMPRSTDDGMAISGEVVLLVPVRLTGGTWTGVLGGGVDSWAGELTVEEDESEGCGFWDCEPLGKVVVGERGGGKGQLKRLRGATFEGKGCRRSLRGTYRPSWSLRTSSLPPSDSESGLVMTSILPRLWRWSSCMMAQAQHTNELDCSYQGGRQNPRQWQQGKLEGTALLRLS